MTRTEGKTCISSRLSAYVEEYRRAMAAAAKAERLAGNLAKAAALIQAETAGRAR